jgi:cell division protein FtsW (lipid II flippase)
MLNNFDNGFFWFIGIFLGVSVVFFGVIRLRNFYADPVLVPIVLVISSIGLVFVTRIDLKDDQNFMSSSSFKQFLAFIIGVLLCVFLVLVVKDQRIFRRYYWTSMLIGIGLLLLPLVPIVGRTVQGSQLWVNFFGFQFQPAEFAKIFLIIFFAGFLIERRDTLALAGPRVLGLQLPRFKDMGPLLFVWGISVVVMVFERDLGTSLLFFGIFIAMLYVATSKISWIIIGLILFGLAISVGYSMFPHFQARVEVWLDPFSQILYERTLGGSYQIVQGLFSLANGGISGTGLGAGYPNMIPFADSDYIFAVIGEEMGLLGVLALLMLYLLFSERIFRQGLGIRDGYGKLLAAGIGFSFMLQVFVVVGGILRVIPLTGLTLPFVARGGSSLIANWILVALLIILSNQARQPYELPEIVNTSYENFSPLGSTSSYDSPNQGISWLVQKNDTDQEIPVGGSKVKDDQKSIMESTKEIETISDDQIDNSVSLNATVDHKDLSPNTPDDRAKPVSNQKSSYKTTGKSHE